MSKVRSRLLDLLKWAFAVGILVALVKSGKLSVKDVETFLRNPTAAILCVAFMGTMFCLAFSRWRLLLASQGVRLPFTQVFQLGMLGQFFSSIIPGTVGGDLIKALYIAKRFPDHKVRTISTIIVDRIMGLCAMMVLGAIAFLVGYGHLTAIQNPNVRLVEALGWVIVAVASSVLLGLGALPWIGRRLPEHLPRFFHRNKKIAAFLGPLYVAAKAYHSKTAYLWLAMGLSFLMHLLNVSVLFVVARAMFGAYPWGDIDAPLFLLGSIMGLTAQAIPVAPMGLGVGQVAFSGIFYALGAPSQTFGASIITGLQVVNFSLSLLGAVFFATYRHEVQTGVELAAS